MPNSLKDEKGSWSVLLIEDEEGIRSAIKEYFEGEEFQGRKLHFHEFSNINDALEIIKDQKADLVILDVYQGRQHIGSEQSGIKVLEKIKLSAFVSVILYTALPESVESYQNIFVRLVGKDVGSLERLKEEISNIFDLQMPLVHRALVELFDKSLCSYMWDFVLPRWDEFQPIANKPEFLRLLVQRLARNFSRENIEQITQNVFGNTHQSQEPDYDLVHPAEYYIKPPFTNNVMLGDIRIIEHNDEKKFFVVLWPSCDFIETTARKRKAEKVLCAMAGLLESQEEMTVWLEAQAGSIQTPSPKSLKKLFTNNRDSRYGTPDRFHFLPGVWDIP